MAHSNLRSSTSSINSDDSREEVFEAAKSGDSVLLNEVLKKLDNTERISVLGVDFQYIGDGCPLPDRKKSPVSPLIVAVRNGNLDCVKVLLKYGADIEERGDFMHNYKIHKSCTPLFIAATCGNDEILRFLVENGANVNATEDFGLTPLMAAVENQLLDAVTFLIDQGADVNVQDGSGLTALYYATEVSFDPLIVKQLDRGTVNLCNSQGMTPLLLACSRGLVAVVENQIKQPEITKEQRISALELLGASVLIEECIRENADLHDWKGFKYIKRGMMERFADPSHPLCKQEMEAVDAYQNRRECQTLEELAEVEGDRDAIIMESLIIRERIMDGNYEDLIAVISKVAHYYENHDLSSCIKLYRHAMKTARKCDLSAVFDLRNITGALFNRFENGDLSKEEDFLDVLDETILDHYYEIQGKMTNERDSWYMLHLFDSLQKLVFMISKFECADEGRLSSSALLLKAISNLNLRDDDSSTLLHWFAIPRGIYSSYSYSGAVKLLLNAGFNVNVINGNGNTTLHIVATLKPSDDKIHLLTDMLQVLFDGGAHHDFVNNDGKTPMDMAGTDEARMILSHRRKLELKCICARAVKKFGIPYMGLVPKTLEKYISMH